MAAFWEYADRDGVVKAKQSVILDAAAMSVSSWHRTFSALAARGYIETLEEHTRTKPGRWRLMGGAIR